MIYTIYDIPSHSYYHIVKKRTVLSLIAALAQPTCLPPEDYEKIVPSAQMTIDTCSQILRDGRVIREDIVFEVHYKKAKDCVKVEDRITGRVNISNEPNLVSLPLYVKGTLLNDHYVNLDIINYHASVLLSLCKQHNIPCPLVETYVHHRDYWLGLVQKQYNVEKKDAKLLFSVLLTVGSFWSWRNQVKIRKGETKEVRAFREEAEEVTEELVKHYPEYGEIEYENGKSNLNRLISFIVRDYENAILELVLKHYQKVRRCIVLNGDGIYILKGDYHEGMEQEIMTLVKEQLGLEITVTKKPIETLDLSDVPYNQILEDKLEDYKDMVQDDLEFVEQMEEGILAADVIHELKTFTGFRECVRSRKMGKNEVILNQKCLQLDERTNVIYETVFSSSMAYSVWLVCYSSV